MVQTLQNSLNIESLMFDSSAIAPHDSRSKKVYELRSKLLLQNKREKERIKNNIKKVQSVLPTSQTRFQHPFVHVCVVRPNRFLSLEFARFKSLNSNPEQLLVLKFKWLEREKERKKCLEANQGLGFDSRYKVVIVV